nr:aminotransferase-like mobile domain-containing protein [Tanacetum cinerariifolium]
MDETFLVLQAAENGFFFLLNKGTENIERGNNSLRLKAYTQSLRARVDGIPPLDFLLVPFGYLNSCGELNLEVCIWNSSDLEFDLRDV